MSTSTTKTAAEVARIAYWDAYFAKSDETQKAYVEAKEAYRDALARARKVTTT